MESTPHPGYRASDVRYAHRRCRCILSLGKIYESRCEKDKSSVYYGYNENVIVKKREEIPMINKHIKENRTRLKSMLLAVIVLFGTIAPAMPVEAAPKSIWDYEIEDGFFYEVMDDGNVNILGFVEAEIDYLVGPDKSLTIPEKLDGKKVTRISSHKTKTTAKSYFHGLKEIIIPDTVTYIDSYAFDYCLELENVVIPDSVEYIGQFAFADCDNLTSVTIPGVEDLRGAVFSDCDNLKTAVVSEGTKYLSGTFMDCDKLTSVTLPNTLKEIERSSFSSCDSLKKISIPKSVTFIEQGAFDTWELEHIYYEGTKTQWEKIAEQVLEAIEREGVKVHCGKAVPEKIKLSKTSYTYDGKSKKPTVTVKDSNGKTINKKYYKVSYSNNKNVGQATVKVTFKDKYKGTVLKETFKIVPKSTKISKVKAVSKGFTVTWKKQKTQTSGYEIQYSTSSKFKNATTVTIKKNTTTSKKITKLKANKKYYVRVRTYKTVKVNGKSKKIYSAWSEKKTITTKK